MNWLKQLLTRKKATVVLFYDSLNRPMYVRTIVNGITTDYRQSDLPFVWACQTVESYRRAGWDVDFRHDFDGGDSK